MYMSSESRRKTEILKNVRIRIVTIVLLLSLVFAIGTSESLAHDGKTPVPPQTENIIYSTEYMNASQALQDSTLQDDETHKNQLLREAIYWYTVDLEKRSDDVAVTYNNRGVAYYRLGEYDLAIAEYNAAMEHSPASADFVKNRGLAYEQMGDLENALADFSTFLSLIADAPSERREVERVYFSAKMSELSQKTGRSESKEEIDKKSPVLSGGGDVMPLWWGWVDYYGNAKTHNDTYPYPGGPTTPNILNWKCEAFYPGHKIENTVWFQLPPITSSRTAHHYYLWAWRQISWDHYYASATGWTPYGSNTYFLQIQNRDVCTGYNLAANQHKIHAWAWYE
ncbi:MAG TPA: tetratricopeptide repeat protein [Anaerolineae bacterium]|nr:tetratricopeptide repeat protein [Anaerolineae bacterium]HQH39087.1 tetratricopeptide repeat protein [Anaerolineae bacterium]